MASPFVESTASILQILIWTLNLVLLLLVLLPPHDRDLLRGLDDEGGESREYGIRSRISSIILSRPVYPAILLIAWVGLSFLSPIFMPDPYRIELFEYLLSNWAGIIFPLAPCILLVISLVIKYENKGFQELKE